MKATGTSRVALVTYPEQPSLTPDDALLAPALEALGAGVVVAPWSDPSVDWSSFGVVVLRSTWDYHLHLDRFIAWTDQLESLGTVLVNSGSLLRWNAEKTYLRQLESSGVPVVPTRWICRGDSERLTDILQSERWDQAVVKPVVSASAYETWRTSLELADGQEKEFRRLVQEGEVMVQPYLSEIEKGGEWSIVYLGNQFSHAVVKRPKPGDFRVQKQFGGSREVIRPSPALLDAAREILDNAPEPTIYARVDGCEIGGRFILMELELIEPELFLGTAQHAAGGFARAIMSSLERK